MPSDRSPYSRDPIPFTVAAAHFEVPYVPAAVWAGRLDRISSLAGALADARTRDRLADAILEHPGAAQDLRDESLRVLGVAGGRKWWEVARLIRTSESPDILGRLVLAGVDPWQRSLGEWCAAVYAVCTKGADEKGRLKFDFSLSIPPRDFEDEWDDDGEDSAATMNAVAAMMGN